MRWGCALALWGTLAGCYSAQSIDLSRSVAQWRAAQPETTKEASPGLYRDQWTVDDLLARALDANPDLLAWQARVDAADAGVDAAGRFADLELRFTEGKLDELADAEPTFEIALRGRPPRPGEIAGREDSARMRAEEVAARRDQARRALRSQVRRLHAEVTLTLGELEVATVEESLRGRRRDLESQRVEQQEATSLDVALAELDRAEVVDEAFTLKSRRDRALARLRRTLDLPPEVPLVLAGPAGGIDPETAPLTSESRQGWIDRALASRAELRETAAALARSHADASVARAGQLPWLGYLQLSYEANKNSSPLTWGFALSVDLPIFAWTGAEVAAEDAVTRQREAEHHAAISGVVRELEARMDHLVHTRQRLDALRATLLPAAETAARLADQAEGVQALDALRAVRLQVARLRAQRRHLDALRAWVIARVRLEEASGP